MPCLQGNSTWHSFQMCTTSSQIWEFDRHPLQKSHRARIMFFSNTKQTATAQQRRVELEDIPLPPLPVLHPKDSGTPFRPKISQTQFANNEWATEDETAAPEEKATPAVGRAQVTAYLLVLVHI